MANPGPRRPSPARSPKLAGMPSQPGLGRRPGRFLLLFSLCFLVGFALLTVPWLTPAMSRFNRALVQAAGTVIHVCGGHADAGGTVLRDPATGLAIEMMDGCNGVNVTVLLCAALLAFPASRTLKAKGLLIGCVAIQSLNLLRFISLFYLRQYNQAWFDFAHHYLWESLIILDALAVFWMWVQTVFRSGAMRDVHA